MVINVLKEFRQESPRIASSRKKKTPEKRIHIHISRLRPQAHENKSLMGRSALVSLACSPKM
jgi:hypothetical protein